MDNKLRDLIEIVHFTEDVSAKIHGVLDEAEIYRTVMEEFVNSKAYTASILLLTDDESKLRIVQTSMAPGEIEAGEKVAGVRLKGYKINLSKSGIYSRVVMEGETLHVRVVDTLREFFPRPIDYLIIKVLGYGEDFSILTLLWRGGKIIGAFAMSSIEMGEHLIPSVRNLVRHISATLELADERAERKQAEEASESEWRKNSLIWLPTIH